MATLGTKPSLPPRLKPCMVSLCSLLSSLFHVRFGLLWCALVKAGHHTQFATEAEAMYGEPLLLVSPYSFLPDNRFKPLWSTMATLDNMPT